MFASLPDNVQETFGLVILEAMAGGLPVLASDWNGYRDLVVDNETGFAVPTYSPRGAAAGATLRLLFGETNYDHFLAECSQTFTVDPVAAADRLARLVSDAPLRRRFGDAGRARVLNSFAWSHVIRRYETLWAEQAGDLPEFAPRRSGPARYPELSQAFAQYPTRWLEPSTVLERVPGAELPDHPLTSVEAHRRIADFARIERVLSARALQTLDEWIANFASGETDRNAAAATVAWLLKYGVLRPVPLEG